MVNDKSPRLNMLDLAFSLSTSKLCEEKPLGSSLSKVLSRLSTKVGDPKLTTSWWPINLEGLHPKWNGPFIMATLQALGFGSGYVQVIKNHVGDASTYVSINHTRSKGIGLLQGFL